MRFHLIGTQIFEMLDNGSLAKCRIVNRSWNTFVNDLKFAWIRKIRFCSLGSNEPLEEILKCTKLDVVKELIECSSSGEDVSVNAVVIQRN